jgi:hypothetical protein
MVDADRDIVMTAPNHTVSNTAVQALADDVVQHISYLSTASDSSKIIEDGHQATTVPPSPSEVTESVAMEARISAVGEYREGISQTSQRIRIHPKLYEAAVQGNVDFLKEFLLSHGKPLIKQFDRTCYIIWKIVRIVQIALGRCFTFCFFASSCFNFRHMSL